MEFGTEVPYICCQKNMSLVKTGSVAVTLYLKGIREFLIHNFHMPWPILLKFGSTEEHNVEHFQIP
jgi:hypothetical protein